MRLGNEGFPLVLLSHRRQEFMGPTMWTLRELMTGVTDLVVVDDSGDAEHHQWLDDHGFQYAVVNNFEGRGYLAAMNRVWGVARELADKNGVDKVMLWEEDFLLSKPVDLRGLAAIIDEDPTLAQLNLQRQAVYRTEQRHGYLESHVKRGYGLTKEDTGERAIPWIKRQRPFTTNPGMIRREVLDVDWPDRRTCDSVLGGAEPAMSYELERRGWHFGWYGEWNTPHTKHVGDDMKTGIGY